MVTALADGGWVVSWQPPWDKTTRAVTTPGYGG